MNKSELRGQEYTFLKRHVDPLNEVRKEVLSTRQALENLNLTGSASYELIVMVEARISDAYDDIMNQAELILRRYET
jgi:hypothetical protein